jgi:glycosyl transferase family 25
LTLSDKFPETFKYGDDETFLNTILYPQIKNDLLIHTNICAHLGEVATPIFRPQQGPTDFCGQVYEANGAPKFSYNDFPKSEQIRWLQAQNQHRLLDNVFRMWDVNKTPYDERTSLLDAAFTANWYLGDIEQCQAILKMFEVAEITPHIMFNASFMYDMWQSRGYKIIGTTDPDREPGEREVVIVYGAYPYWVHSLPHSRKILTNVQNLFGRVRHQTFEFDPVWEPVDEIWIMGLEERHDRLVETCLELARLGAPMHRIKHYKAKKDGRSPYYGATKNHLDVVQAFQDGPARRALFLEDDFCFTSSVQDIKAELAKFWSRPYDFHIAFLAASKTGRREIEDDLLLRTYQPCTTSSAYFLQKPRSQEVLAVIKDGYQKMEETGNTNTYCIDRYWAKLAPQHRMFIFRTKLGFQRATYSNIQGRVTYNLD